MEVDLDVTAASAVPLHHFWNEVVGAGRANEALRADWQEQLRTVRADAGFRYVRFHGLFHDDMFVYREVDGVVSPTFHYVDRAFDAILQAGMRPFVEFGFSPPELAREKGTVFWWGANGSPPVDLGRWADLVRATVEHWVGRYGLAEVRDWYFEIWNEPNLHPFFRGTKSEYFELYRVSVEAIRSVDPHLRVGGPATSNFVPDARFDGEIEDVSEHAVVVGAPDLDALSWRPVWIEDFLTYCARNDLPVDFVSCHPYPTDWALDEHSQGRKLTRGAGATPTDLRTLRRIVDTGPYPGARIHLTEWNSSSSSRDHTHDYPQAATFVVKANLESIGLVDSLAYWTFTDVFEEEGGGRSPFHGGFGMLSQDGIPKPTMHAYRMLSSLGDELLHQQDGAVVTRHSHSGRVTALIYHYPDDVTLTVPASFEGTAVADSTLASGAGRRLSVAIAGLQPGAAATLEILDPEHGWAAGEWQRLGSPVNLTRADLQKVGAAGRRTLFSGHTVGVDGVLRIVIDLAPWSVALLMAA